VAQAGAVGVVGGGDRPLLAAACGAKHGVAHGARAHRRAALLIRRLVEALAAQALAAVVTGEPGTARVPAIAAKRELALEAVLDAVLALAAPALASALSLVRALTCERALVAHDVAAVAVHVAVDASTVAAEGARAADAVFG
jgi:hypothetical protein